MVQALAIRLYHGEDVSLQGIVLMRLSELINPAAIGLLSMCLQVHGVQ